jgi:hypothetical protein
VPFHILRIDLQPDPEDLIDVIHVVLDYIAPGPGIEGEAIRFDTAIPVQSDKPVVFLAEFGPELVEVDNRGEEGTITHQQLAIAVENGAPRTRHEDPPVILPFLCRSKTVFLHQLTKGKSGNERAHAKHNHGVEEI